MPPPWASRQAPPSARAAAAAAAAVNPGQPSLRVAREILGTACDVFALLGRREKRREPREARRRALVSEGASRPRRDL